MTFNTIVRHDVQTVPAVWLYNVNSNKSEKTDERRAQRRPALIVWCKLLDLLIILLRSISHSINYFFQLRAAAAAIEAAGSLFCVLIYAGRLSRPGWAGWHRLI